MPKELISLVRNKMYSTFDVMELCGIGRSRLVHWMRGGFTPKGTEVAWGKGSRTLYSFGEVLKIYLFKNFVDVGFRREVAKKLVDKKYF